MYGPQILARTLTVPQAKPDSHGNRWQYSSRGDRHSKLACWVTLFDLLHTSGMLRRHVAEGKVAFGINHDMVDFEQSRKKNLDLVLCRPSDSAPKGNAPKEFALLVDKYGIKLTPEEQSLLTSFPALYRKPVGSVVLALEAKAAMTEHSKARPRLYDELNSSHLTIHGASPTAIAAGFVMVNVGETFVSPTRNKFKVGRKRAVVTEHNQPKAATAIVQKIEELPRRSSTEQRGFDALTIVAIDCPNDGSPIQLVESPPAPQPQTVLHYEFMVRRLAHLYESRFPLV